MRIGRERRSDVPSRSEEPRAGGQPRARLVWREARPSPARRTGLNIYVALQSNANWTRTAERCSEPGARNRETGGQPEPGIRLARGEAESSPAHRIKYLRSIAKQCELDENGGAMFRAGARNRSPVASPSQIGLARGEAESSPAHRFFSLQMMFFRLE